MSKKNPCGLDFCPYKETAGEYASCVDCVWAEDDSDEERKDNVDKIMYKVTMSPFKYVAEWQDIGLKFICSHCGFELDGEFPWFEMDLPDYMPAYCPKCGIPMKTGSE